jgi:regulator of sirC expression with transglutaminase-like and TPR domain
MKAEGGHWYRIRFLGSPLETPLEQARMLEVISNAMVGRARRAAAKRAAGEVVTVRPARIYAHREDGVIVWHLNDGALALYRTAGGLREPDAHVAALPDVDGMRRVLSGRYYT